MSFHLLLLLVLAAAAFQILRRPARSLKGAGRTLLLWVLVGYCGLPMAAFMVFGLVHPADIARLTGFEPGSPFQAFVTWGLLGMSLSATLALRYRESYMVGPAVAWAVFFAGATEIHLRQYAAAGALDLHAGLLIFATHGFISVLLLSTLAASGLWRTAFRSTEPDLGTTAA